MDFHSMKRKELQALCKRHHLPANKTNIQMADSLASLLKKPDVEPIEDKAELEASQVGDGSAENDSKDATRKSKRVRFCLEEEQNQVEVIKQIEEKTHLQLKSAMKPGFEKSTQTVQVIEPRVTRSRKLAEVVFASPKGSTKLRKVGNTGNEDAEKSERGRKPSGGTQTSTFSYNATKKDADAIAGVSLVEGRNKRQRMAKTATKEVVEESLNASKPEKGAPKRSRRNTLTVDNAVLSEEKSELLLKEKHAIPETEIQVVNEEFMRAPAQEKAPKRAKTKSRSNNASEQSDGQCRTDGASEKNASLVVEGESENAPKLGQAVRRSKRIAPSVKELNKSDELLGSTGNQQPLHCITNIVKPSRTSSNRESKRKSLAVIDGEPPSITNSVDRPRTSRSRTSKRKSSAGIDGEPPSITNSVERPRISRSRTSKQKSLAVVDGVLPCIASNLEPPRTSHNRALKQKPLAVIDGEPPSITNTKELPRTSESRTLKRKSLVVVEGAVIHQTDGSKNMKQKQLAEDKSSVNVIMDSESIDSSNLLLSSRGADQKAIPEKDVTECQNADTNETQGSLLPKSEAKQSQGKGSHQKSMSKLANKKDSLKEVEVSTEDLTEVSKSAIGSINEVLEDVTDEVVPAGKVISVELCMAQDLQVNAIPESTIPIVQTKVKVQDADTATESSLMDEPVESDHEPKSIAMKLVEQTNSKESEELLNDDAEHLVGMCAKLENIFEVTPTNGSLEIQVEVSEFKEETSPGNAKSVHPLSSTDAILLTPNEPTPSYSTADMKDGSVTSSQSVCSSIKFKEAFEKNKILVSTLEYSGEAPSDEKLKQNLHFEGVMHLSSEVDLSEPSMAQSQEVLKEMIPEDSAGNLENVNVTGSSDIDDRNEAEVSLLKEPGMKDVQETLSMKLMEPLISPRESVTNEDYFNFSNNSSKTISSNEFQVDSKGDNDVEKVGNETFLELPAEIAVHETNHSCMDSGNVAEDVSTGVVHISQANSLCGVDVVDMQVARTKNEARELSEQTIFESKSIFSDSKSVDNCENEGVLPILKEYSSVAVNIENSVQTEEEIHEVLEAHMVFKSNNGGDDKTNVVKDEVGSTSRISQAYIPSMEKVEVNVETMEAVETVEDENKESSLISQEPACSPCMVNVEEDTERKDEKDDNILEENIISKTDYGHNDGGIVEEIEKKGVSSIPHGYFTIDVKDGSVSSSKSFPSSKTFKEYAEANRVLVGILEYSAEASSNTMGTKTDVGNQKEHVDGVIHLSSKHDISGLREIPIVKSREVQEEKIVEVGLEDSSGNFEKLNVMASCKFNDKNEIEASLSEDFDMKNVREASSLKLMEPLISNTKSVKTIKTVRSPASQDDLESDCNVAKMGAETTFGFSEEIVALETNVADDLSIRPLHFSQESQELIARAEETTMCRTADYENIVGEVEDTKCLEQAEEELTAEFLKQNTEDLLNLIQAVAETDDKIVDVPYANSIEVDGSGGDEYVGMPPSSHDTFEVQVVDVLQQRSEELLNLKSNELHSLSNSEDTKNTKSAEELKEFILDTTSGTSPFMEACSPNVNNKETSKDFESNDGLLKEEKPADSALHVPEQTNEINKGYLQRVCGHSNVECDRYLLKSDSLEGEALHSHLFNGKIEDVNGKNIVSSSSNIEREMAVAEDDYCVEDDEDMSFSQIPEDEDGCTEHDKHILRHQEAVDLDYNTSQECEENSPTSSETSSLSHDFPSIDGSRDFSKEIKDEETSQGLHMIAETKDNVLGLDATVLDQNISGSSTFTERTSGQNITLKAAHLDGVENNKDGEDTLTDGCLGTTEEAEFLGTDFMVDELGVSSDDENVNTEVNQVSCSESPENILPEKGNTDIFDGDNCDNSALDFTVDDELNLLSELASEHTGGVQVKDNMEEEGSLVVHEESTKESDTLPSHTNLLCERLKLNVESSSVVNIEQAVQMHKKEEVVNNEVYVEDCTIQESFEMQQQGGSENYNYVAETETPTDVTETGSSSHSSNIKHDSAITTKDTGCLAADIGLGDQVEVEGEGEYPDSKATPLGTSSHFEDVINETLDAEDVRWKHLENFEIDKDNAGKELENALYNSIDAFPFKKEDTGCSLVLETGCLPEKTGLDDQVEVEREGECLDSKVNPLGTPHFEDVIAGKVGLDDVCLKHLEDFETDKDNAGKELETESYSSEDTFSLKEEYTGCSVIIALEAHSEVDNVNSELQCEVNDFSIVCASKEGTREEVNASLSDKSTDSLEYCATDRSVGSLTNHHSGLEAPILSDKVVEETVVTVNVRENASTSQVLDTFLDEENCNGEKETHVYEVYTPEPCEDGKDNYCESHEHQTILESAGGSSYDVNVEMQNTSKTRGDVESETYEFSAWEIELFSEDNAGQQVATFIQEKTFEQTLDAMVTSASVPDAKDACLDESMIQVMASEENTICSSDDLKMEFENASTMQGRTSEGTIETMETFEAVSKVVEAYHINAGNEVQPEEMVSIHAKNESVEISMTEKEKNSESCVSPVLAMESTPKRDVERNIMDEIYSKMTKMHISSTVKAKRYTALTIQRTPKRPSGLSTTGMKENVKHSSNAKEERSVNKRRVFGDLQNIRNR